MTDWYVDWQHQGHVELFDGRHLLSRANLLRNYEAFNDVRLLNERVDQTRPRTLLEVGCATGEFSRYLRFTYPAVDYYGIDISQPAIARARQKYPHMRYFLGDPGLSLAENVKALRIPDHPEVVYAKDVIHHQTQPLAFLSGLLRLASEAVILRTRTRDAGETVTDPEHSCQYHYGGWMPYIVLNLQELIDHVQREAPRCEVVVYRNHMILGGRENRFLPKECYLPQTGTAETAVGVFLSTGRPGRVHLEDRKDQDLEYPLQVRLMTYVDQVLRRCASWPR